MAISLRVFQAALEASRVLAATLLGEHLNDKDVIAKAFRTIVCRTPEANELEVLIRYYNKQRESMTQQNAIKTLAVGEYPVDKSADPKTLAAFMRVISAIYNLEETITKS